MTAIPAFRYDGKDASGAVVSGVIQAPSRSVATVRLRAQGIWIERLVDEKVLKGATKGGRKPVPAGGIRWSPLYGLNPVSATALGHFFTQLASLYHAGTGMQTVVDSLAEGPLNAALRRFLDDVRPRVAAGEPLSNCMESYPQVFSAGVVGMVRTGELTGNLDEVARTLAEEYVADGRARWLLLLPRVYFVAVLFVASLVISFPRIITEGFQWWSQHVVTHVLPWWVIALLVWTVLRVAWHLPPVMEFRERAAGGMLPWSTLVRRVALYRVTYCLGLTARAGVDAGSGVETATQAAGDRRLVEEGRRAAERVRTGTPLHEALAACSFIPKHALADLAVAGTGGTFEAALMRMAEEAKVSRDKYVRGMRLGAVGAGYVVTSVLVAAVVIYAVYSVYAAQAERAGVQDMWEDLLR